MASSSGRGGGGGATDDLPLRIRAEHTICGLLHGRGSCASLALPGSETVIVIAEAGIVAFGSEGLERGVAPRPPSDSTSTVEWPRYSFSADGSRLAWWEDGKALTAPPRARDLEERAVKATEAWADRVVECIRRYYSKQVLEPSVRGFLSILEKVGPSEPSTSRCR